MEQVTLLYTLFVLFGSIVLSSCLFQDHKTWIFGWFFFVVFLCFAWLTYTEIFNQDLKTDALRAHVFRGLFSVGILGLIVYRSIKYKWRHNAKNK